MKAREAPLVVAAFLEELARRGLIERELLPEYAGRLCVSKSKNLLLDESLLLKGVGSMGLGKIEEMVASLSEDGAELVAGLLKGGPRRQVRPLDWWAFRAWRHDFLMYHARFSASIAERFEPWGGVPGDGLAGRVAGCMPDVADFVLETGGGARACRVRCTRCGLEAVALASAKIHFRADVRQEAQVKSEESELARKALFGDREFLLAALEALKDEARTLLDGYVVEEKGRQAAGSLDRLAEGVRRGQVSVAGGKASIGGVPIPVPTGEGVIEAAKRLAGMVHEHCTMSREEFAEIWRRMWEEGGEAAYREIAARYEQLTPLERAAPSNQNVWSRLSRLREDCLANRLKASRTRNGKWELPDYGLALKELEPEELRRVVQGAGAGLFRKTLQASDLPWAVPILRAVGDHQGDMGVGTLAALLTGSKSARIRGRGLERSPHFGKLAGQTQGSVAQKIEKLKAAGLLEVEYVGLHDLPVLVLPAPVKGVLSSVEKTAAAPAVLEEARTAVQGRQWDDLPHLEKEGCWQAGLALQAAAALIPTGTAAKVLRKS